jgi:hypothetical protein
MGKKFLYTKESRRAFIRWVLVGLSLILGVVVVITAFSEGQFLHGDRVVFFGDWWVFTAQLIVFGMIAAVLVAVMGVALLAFGWLLYFLMAPALSAKTLRSYSPRYDSFAWWVGDSFVPSIKKGIAFPFRKSSAIVRNWINSGS